jgi:hypothetical protein
VIVLWLMACGGDTSQDSADSADTGTAETECRVGVGGVLYGDDRTSPTQESGGRVTALSADGDRVETRSLDDGTWSLPLWEGTWTLSGENAGGNCVSEESVEVALSVCTWESVDVYTELCFG